MRILHLRSKLTAVKICTQILNQLITERLCALIKNDQIKFCSFLTPVFYTFYVKCRETAETTNVWLKTYWLWWFVSLPWSCKQKYSCKTWSEKKQSQVSSSSLCMENESKSNKSSHMSTCESTFLFIITHGGDRQKHACTFFANNSVWCVKQIHLLLHKEPSPFVVKLQ